MDWTGDRIGKLRSACSLILFPSNSDSDFCWFSRNWNYTS